METVAAAIRALRAGPVTAAQLGERIGLQWRAAYRLIDEFIEAGAPIEISEAEVDSAAPGQRAKTYRLTMAGLRRWIG